MPAPLSWASTGQGGGGPPKADREHAASWGGSPSPEPLTCPGAAGPPRHCDAILPPVVAMRRFGPVRPAVAAGQPYRVSFPVRTSRCGEVRVETFEFRLRARTAFAERLALLYGRRATSPETMSPRPSSGSSEVDERGRPVRVSAQRISDWRRAKNVPAQFPALAAVLHVLMPPGAARPAGTVSAHRPVRPGSVAAPGRSRRWPTLTGERPAPTAAAEQPRRGSGGPRRICPYRGLAAYRRAGRRLVLRAGAEHAGPGRPAPRRGTPAAWSCSWAPPERGSPRCSTPVWCPLCAPARRTPVTVRPGGVLQLVPGPTRSAS